MRQQNPSQADAQALLTGFSSTQSLFPRHSLRTWARALWWSIYLLSAFDAGQSRLAQEKLALVPLTSSPTCHFPLVLRVAAVRRDAARLRTWLHLLLDQRACYAESFALCAGLRILGWDARLVVGYAVLTLHSPTALHAWVAYEGEVVSDRPDIASGYLELEQL